ncbi:dihydrodipicolinate synthase family protein [Olsenella sp. HMSC062G07]|uniref:dihydrodipicolinate synthase family protein n=1 Tax=Olsenella sp. HMSC062G07 TaxID=1739330 RepID=UPI0008CAA4DB|nr:dihydrodipicolinate synthase family protein [Olsenella sp. HMSC062G07]OFK23673.1 dihydrodipicolinate synthase family protein [Olsenella sp. HMSC062G07]
MSKIDLKGIITAMVTPFAEDESLDAGAAAFMADWLVERGVHGIFIAGTNGEFHLMDDDEKVCLTRAVVKAVDGRVPVIAGAGCCSTLHTIELGLRLMDAGADVLSVVTPYYLVPNQDDLYIHYERIAERVNAPVVMYNIPGQTGCKIEPETVDRLAGVDGIVGIKDSGGDFDTQLAYIESSKSHSGFAVLNGSDSLMLRAFEAGASASVAATSNIIPEVEVKLYNDFLAGRLDEAKIGREMMDPLRKTLKKCVAPAVMKQALNMMGVRAGITRTPVRMPAPDVVEEIDEMLKFYGIAHSV